MKKLITVLLAVAFFMGFTATASAQTITLSENVTSDHDHAVSSYVYECPASLSLNYDYYIPVDVDIKPGACPNPLNLKKKGVLPTAILGSMDLDVTYLDPASIRLMEVPPLRFAYEDVATPFHTPTGKGDCLQDCTSEEKDGYIDLTLKFDAQKVVAALIEEFGDVAHKDCVVLTITGKLSNGSLIQGEDVVSIHFDTPYLGAGFGDGLAVDFDSYGLWGYDGTSWMSLAGWNPEGNMEVWTGGLAVDFGSYGLWNYDGSSWTSLTGWNPEDIIDVDLY